MKRFEKPLWFLIFFLSLNLASPLFGQIKKGKRLMEEGRYTEALRPLKKAFEKEGNLKESGLLLMECHHRLQEYQEALDVGALIGMSDPDSPEEARLFADVRIANNDFSGAYLGLINYIARGASDESIYFWLDKASYLLSWDTINGKSTIEEVSGLNSIYNEYAPRLSEDELWFVSDQVTVQVLFPTAYTNQSIHVLYRTKPDSEDGLSVSRPKMLMKERDYYYHDGPMAYWKEQDLYALSLREIEGLLTDLKTGIFFSDLSGSEAKLKPFKHNQGYNTGHPTFAKDGKRMYFASNRPGGYGQMDIWYSDWENGDWTVPINAGPTVNTPGNEIFPFYIRERLFYSSDRRDKGYGGLDLYYISLQSEDQEPYNLRAPINGPYDDFALALRDDFTGYVSSNRVGGQGGDDLYAVEFIPQQERLDSIRFAIEGTANAPVAMKIFDSKGNEVKGVEVDRFGMATVSEIYTRELYTLKTEGLFDEGGTLVVYDPQGKPVRRFTGQGNSFEFELLDHEKYQMAREENVDNSELFDLFGEVKAEEDVPFDSVSVVLQDAKGKNLSETRADTIGRFSFKGLQAGRDYGLVTKGIDVPHGIDLLGKTGAPTQSLDESYPNTFAFTRAVPEAAWMMAAEIVTPVVFGMVPTTEIDTDTRIELFAHRDSLIRSCPIDEDGFIEIGSLTAGHAYEMKFTDQTFEANDKLVILGGSGDTTQTVRPRGVDSYVFEYMIYGEEPDDAMSDYEASILYHGSLEGWAFDKAIPFLLTRDDGGEMDTVLVRPDGNFSFMAQRSGAYYTFRPLTRQEETGGARLLVFDIDQNVIVDTYADAFGIFKFDLLPDEDYEMGKQANLDESALDYEGLIADWNGRQNATFLLSTADGIPIDTIRLSDNGAFTLTQIKPGGYQLKLMNSGVELYDKELTLYVQSGQELLIVNSNDGKSYVFELLEDEVFALAKQKNEDSSELTINLNGKTDIDEENKRVKLFDQNGNLLAETYTLAGGEFAFRSIPMDSVFVIEAEGATEMEVGSDQMGFKLEGEIVSGGFRFDFREAAGKERIISLPDVYYAFNSYGLNAKSKAALDDLAELLDRKSSMRIKILSHTDSRGPATYNKTLSQRRAEEVVKYLTSRGIDPGRLDSEGRGEEDLINRCKDGVRCSNAEHALNRRTEFVIIGD